MQSPQGRMRGCKLFGGTIREGFAHTKKRTVDSHAIQKQNRICRSVRSTTGPSSFLIPYAPSFHGFTRRPMKIILRSRRLEGGETAGKPPRRSPCRRQHVCSRRLQSSILRWTNPLLTRPTSVPSASHLDSSSLSNTPPRVSAVRRHALGRRTPAR